MEFLVEIEFSLPDDLTPSERAALLDAESQRARELIEQGIIKRIWRIPGRRANVGIWECDDASALHDALASLPFFPWMDINVRALAQHPDERAESGRRS